MNKRDKWFMQEAQIIKDCQNNDLGAYKKIYDRYEQPLLHTAVRILGHQQDAEDAVQMTFIKLYRNIGNYHFGARFSTYLFRILINTCYDLLKKRNRMNVLDVDPQDLAAVPSSETNIDLANAILTLPEKMRACFVLFAVEGIPQNDIAEILRLSVGGVKSNVFHAKRKLRTLLTFASREDSHAL